MQVKLKDVCTVITDGSHSSPIGIKKGYPMLSVKDMRSMGFDYSDCKFISKKDYDILVRNGCKPQINDILIAKDGSYLKEVFVIKEDVDQVILSSIAILRPDTTKINPYFLMFYLQTESVKEIVANKYVSGSALQRIILKNFKEIEIDLPDRPTQDKIVEILSNIDNQIERNNEMTKRLQVLAQSTYSRWFNQFEFPNDEGLSYKTNGGKFEYNEELKREIPTDWKVENLYFIADYVNGLACQKHRPLDENKKLPVIKITEMHNGITSETEFVRSDVDEKYIINNGDILFSWSATLETMLWCGGKGVLNQHIFKVNSKNNFSDSFVFLQLSNYIINFVKIAEARKTTMGHITTEHLKQSKIVVPPINVIEKFDAICKPLFEQIIILNKENIELNNFKSKLLPLLINGQLKV